MEKETLEKAAYQARRDYQDEFGKDGMNECIMFDAMKIQKGFQLGAKWQAERTYSEDEVRELLIKALTHNDYNLCGSLATRDWEIRTANFNVWFEENKKK